MEIDRLLGRRVAIGLVVMALFLLLAYVAVQFVAVIVFAVFLYYAVRPIHRTLLRFGISRRLGAGLSLLLFGVPFVILLTYTIAIVVVETLAFVEAYDVEDQVIERALAEIDVAGLDLDELQQVVAGAATQASLWVVIVSLAGAINLVSSAIVQFLILVVLTYYLLVDGPRFVSWLLETFDESGVWAAYVRETDPELSMTLFGNIVNVFITAIVGVTTFYTYNVFAPAVVQVPFPALVGALAGIGSLIPVIGIKLVYVPVTVALAANAWFAGDLSLLVPVAVLFAVSAILVDFIPDFFVRAHVSGDQTHTGLLLVSYIVGPLVFGFYGLFLLPILLILGINAVHVLVPYALSGTLPTSRQLRLTEFDDGSDAGSTSERTERNRVLRRGKP